MARDFSWRRAVDDHRTIIVQQLDEQTGQEKRGARIRGRLRWDMEQVQRLAAEHINYEPFVTALRALATMSSANERAGASGDRHVGRMLNDAMRQGGMA